MKKSLTVLLLTLLCLGGVYAQSVLNQPDAFYIYLKGSGYQLTETDYEDYAKVCENDTYKKYSNDEFEWEDQFEIIKQNFNSRISNANQEQTFQLVTSIGFGKYDSTREGYVVEISDSIYIPLNSLYEWSSYASYPSRNSITLKRIALKLDSFSDYSLIPMDKETAKTFLQGRKNSLGDVNRNVTLLIKFTLADFDSVEYNNFKNLALSNNMLPLVGIISEIEVWDTTGKTEKKIGTLVK